MLTHRLHQFEFNVGNNVRLLSVVLDQLVQGVTVRNPANESSVLTERNNGVSSNGQIFFACLWVNGQQSIHQAK